MKFGKLMSDFKVKVHQDRFRLGLHSRPHWGSLQRSPGSLAGIKGPYFFGREWEGKGRERKYEEGREGEGKGGRGRAAGNGRRKEGRGKKRGKERGGRGERGDSPYLS